MCSLCFFVVNIPERYSEYGYKKAQTTLSENEHVAMKTPSRDLLQNIPASEHL
jgi:hypothetical protein